MKALPNAFELFGVDFLVTQGSGSGALQAMLLEMNAEPAIEMTGARLTWILDDLFKAIAETCVEPFFRGDGPPENSGKQARDDDARSKPVLLRECYRRERWI